MTNTQEKKSKEVASRERDGELLARLRRDINGLFDGFFEDRWPMLSSFEGVGRGFGADVAHMDVSETDDGLEVEVELPGMSEKDVEVELTSDSLSIRGEKSDEKEEKRKDYVTRERSYGSFHRSLRLDGDFDVDKAKATFKKGVLRVSLPRTKDARARRKRIDIKAE